jgi:hypothetical protein
MNQNLSAEHNPDWALFLPSISSFYISGIGKERSGAQYFPPGRLPASIPSVESLNFLNSKQGLFHYKWGLHSAGHANLDTTVVDPTESVVRDREPGTFILGDSGGYQIFSGQWPANWKDPADIRAAEKRRQVLAWLEAYSDYGMCLDVPSRIALNPDLGAITGIWTYADSVAATHINNEYFVKNRTGKCKILNVLQGGNNAESDDWYEEMKKYSDPAQYPETHFNGWAAGGENVLDVHMILRRLVTLIHDKMLEPGLHDWVHYLGISWLEYGVLFSAIQKNIRLHHNPNFTISYDCASPFLAAAKGQCYYDNVFPQGEKWSYRMQSTASDKKYAGDTRGFRAAVLADGVHKKFTDSPVTSRLTMGDLCVRGAGFLNKHGKETSTAYDTMSYVLLQNHNLWMHLTAVQEANRRYEQGATPKLLQDERFELVRAVDIIERIFSANNRVKSLQIIDDYAWFWKKFRGRKPSGATMFNDLFSVDTDSDDDTSLIGDID